MSQKPARVWRSNLAAFAGVRMSPIDTDAPVIPSPGPRCQGVVYAPSTFALTVGVPMTPVTPTVVGASPSYWSITPAPPAGIVLNNGTGTISGTPTATKASQVYTIRAEHSDDEILTPVTIGVT